MRDGVAVEFSSPAKLDLVHAGVAAASRTDRHFGKYYVAAFTAAATEKAWRASRFGWNAKIGRIKEIHDHITAFRHPGVSSTGESPRPRRAHCSAHLPRPLPA